MTQIVEDDSTKSTIEKRLRQNFRSDERSVTDKYWCFFFYFVFVIWYTTCYYASYLHRSDSEDKSHNEANTKNATEIFPYSLWGKSWLFDALTCNLVSLSEHYERSGSIVIWANLLICFFLIKYSLSSMRNLANYNHLKNASLALIIFTIRSRSSAFPYHPKIHLWLIPEAILVWYTIKACMRHSRDTHQNKMNNSYLRDYEAMCSVFLILCVYDYLIVKAIKVAHKLDWDNISSYVMIGGCCYISLTVLYFWLLAMACAVDMNIKSTGDAKCSFENLSRGFVRVFRYHFGTVCYHATLIFPILEVLFVVSEPEFRKEFGFRERFFTLPFKMNNLTLISTATVGTGHSESSRELLRHFTGNLKPKLEHFQGFSKIARSWATLLLATNSLLLLFLWICDQDDLHLSLATWSLYCRLLIPFALAMKIHDVLSDTTLFHSYVAPSAYSETHPAELEWSEFSKFWEKIHKGNNNNNHPNLDFAPSKDLPPKERDYLYEEEIPRTHANHPAYADDPESLREILLRLFAQIDCNWKCCQIDPSRLESIREKLRCFATRYSWILEHLNHFCKGARVLLMLFILPNCVFIIMQCATQFVFRIKIIGTGSALSDTLYYAVYVDIILTIFLCAHDFFLLFSHLLFGPSNERYCPLCVQFLLAVVISSLLYFMV